MFWTTRLVTEVKAAFADRIAAGDTLHIRDEKTLSGKPHIGSLRSGSMHAFLAEALMRDGVKVEYRYEVNDTDAFDAVPAYVPAEFKQYLGKRLKDVPSPSGTHANYAEEMGEGYLRVMLDAGFPVSYYRQSTNYEAGKYDEAIRTAIAKKDQIRAIYKEVSGSQKDEDWYPIQVVCQNCGKIATTVVTSFDGEQVTYVCKGVGYVEGCKHEGRMSPFGGNGTLPWKVEWAAKWSVNGTDIEGAGKDHYAAGGSRTVSNRISDEVFDRPHPFDIRHEFILVDGGKKMSSSKGTGAAAEDVAKLLPMTLFRFFLLHKDPMKTLDFSPAGDTIPLLFDAYDAAMREYYKDPADETRMGDSAEAFYAAHDGSVPPKMELPRFSLISFIAQMPHLSLEKEAATALGRELTRHEKEELAVRSKYAAEWLEKMAPESYRFKFGDNSDGVMLDDEEKAAVKAVEGFLLDNPDATGPQIHEAIHGIKERLAIAPKKLFTAFYRLLLGRDSGPQLGFLLGALPRSEVLAILAKV